MKYAIVGPRGRILQVLDAPTDGSLEITDEQADTVNSSESSLFLIDGELKSVREAFDSRLSPEQREANQAREAGRTAFNTASAAFAQLPLGKQALWEPVRQKVGQALLAADFASAREILETTPVIYEGAEADRDAFLALLV